MLEEPAKLKQDFSFDECKILYKNLFDEVPPSMEYLKLVVGNSIKEGHDRFRLHEIRDLILQLPFY
jgi:hypothetical protein